MKILVLHHPYDRPRFEQDFLDRLGDRAAFDMRRADLAALAEGRLGGGLAGYAAVIVFVAFSRLRAAAALDWQGYGGLRVLFDHDAIQNYSDIFGPSLRGAWPTEFRRHRFDLLLTSGGAVQRRLAAEGIPAAWLPKGFAPERFQDLPGPRQGVVTYGSAYVCRKLAERALVAARLPLTRLPFTPYPELAPLLSRHLAALAISADLGGPHWLRGALRRVPARFVPMRPGLEPMAKLFEAAGAGCCPVADDMEDLGPLGFVEGQSAITFRTYRELVEKLDHWLARPEELRALGHAAARLAHERHGWDRRAATLEALIAAHLAGQGQS